MSGSRLLEKSRALKGYSVFVAQIRRKTAAGVCLEEAVKQAIRYCIEQDLLAEYFLEREMEEVFDMVSFKWDPELAKRVQLQEAQEIGMEKGMEKTMIMQKASHKTDTTGAIKRFKGLEGLASRSSVKAVTSSAAAGK